MMRNILSALAALAFTAAPAFAQTVAFVTNLKGEVSLDGVWRPALLAEVAKGQKIVVARDSALSVMYAATGKEYVLKGPGEFVVRDTEIVAPSGMPPLVRNTEWRTSNKTLEAAAQTSAASVRMRSIAQPKGASSLMIFPTAGRVATLQPTLRWRADASPGAVEVALYIPGEEKPVHSAIAADGSYRMPAALKADTEYVWTIAAAGQELGSGRFRTLGAEALQRVDMHRPAERSEFSDRVLFAVMLQEMGAQQEAREAWTRLSLERGDLPELASLAK
jgi:hypothetical protein